MTGMDGRKRKAESEGGRSLPHRGRVGLAGALLLLALSPAGVDVSVALKEQAQAAYFVGVRMVDDLRLVWEIRSFLNRRDVQPKAPAKGNLPVAKSCNRSS